MSEESGGTARLGLAVDIGNLDTAIQAAQNRITGMSSAAQAEFEKRTGAQRRAAEGALKQADTLGYSRQQQILYNAALKGVPVGVLDELRKKLEGTAQASDAGTQASQRSAAAAEQDAERKFKVVRYNNDLNESERSLAERRAAGTSSLQWQTKATTD